MFCNPHVADSQESHIWAAEGTGIPSGEQDDIRAWVDEWLSRTEGMLCCSLPVLINTAVKKHHPADFSHSSVVQQTFSKNLGQLQH